MAARAKVHESWSTAAFVLQNGEVAEKGNIACLDLSSGEAVVAQTGTGFLTVGWFEDSFTGNGTKKIVVRFPSEKRVVGFLNSANPNDVAANDIGNVCYLAGPATVTTSASGNSVAGRIWGVDSLLVCVELASDMGIQGPQGEPGE